MTSRVGDKIRNMREESKERKMEQKVQSEEKEGRK